MVLLQSYLRSGGDPPGLIGSQVPLREAGPALELVPPSSSASGSSRPGTPTVVVRPRWLAQLPTLAFSSSVLHGRHRNRGLAEVLQANDQLGETHTGGRVQLVIGERVAFEGLDGNHQQVGRKGQPEGPLLPQSPETMRQSHSELTCGWSPAQDAHRRGVCEGGNPWCCLPSPEPWLHRP